MNEQVMYRLLGTKLEHHKHILGSFIHLHRANAIDSANPLLPVLFAKHHLEILDTQTVNLMPLLGAPIAQISQTLQTVPLYCV